MLSHKLYLNYFLESFIPLIVASLFEGIMKRNSKRWSDNVAIGSYKHVVSRDSNLASLLGAIAITNLFSIQHKFVQYLPPWPYHTPLKNKSAKLLDYSCIVNITNHFLHPVLLFGHYSLLRLSLFILASFTKGVTRVQAGAYTKPCAIK